MIAVLPASFRGAPFAVRTDGGDAGRRQARHTYPGRDGVFPEDLGRRGRGYRIQGFIVSDSVVYGGGPVALQLQLLLAAAEAKGPGLLVHPTLGVLTVSCEGLSYSGDLGAGTTIDVEWTFLEYTQQLFPILSAATGDLVATAALALDGVCVAAFEVSSLSAIAASSSAPELAGVAGKQWSDQVQAAGQDATSLVNLASQLPGSYGRYFAGGNSGFLTPSSVYKAASTVADLVASASAQRADIAAALAQCEAGLAGVSASTAAAAAATVQALLASLLSACADPGDALRLLTALSSYAPTGPAAASLIGGAVEDLFQRAIVGSAARACSAYQPSSYDDAQAQLAAITALIDEQITVAGDQGVDDIYDALQDLRVSVVADLTARGANLAPLMAVTRQTNLPSLVLAQQLYADASRADQLVMEAGAACISPLFMPAGFQALAA